MQTAEKVVYTKEIAHFACETGYAYQRTEGEILKIHMYAEMT